MLFLFTLIMPILFAISSLVFLIIAKVKKEGKHSITAAIFSALMTLVTLVNVDVPEPFIFPLDNATQIYQDDGMGVMVFFETNGLFKVYYSTDGTNPKEGNLYRNPIFLTETTTVCAVNKFLWWWSDIEISSYTIESTDDYNKEETESIADEQNVVKKENDHFDHLDRFDNKAERESEEENTESAIGDDTADDSQPSIESNSAGSNNIKESEPPVVTETSSESALLPETEPVQAQESDPIEKSEQADRQDTETEVIYSITLMDKNGKDLSNKKFLITQDNAIIAEVYTDETSTFYLAGNVIKQPVDWRTLYELKLCKEIYSESGERLTEYGISKFNITETDFIVLCDAYLE